MSLVEQLRQRFYDRGAGWVDGTTRFAQMIRAELAPGIRVLDLGAGPSTDEPLVVRGDGRRVFGLDPSQAIVENEALDQRARGVGEALPFRDQSFDLVFANWVAEHLAEPNVVADEVKRVLRPGGRYLFRTVSLHHYMPAIASRTPHWFHELVANRVRGLPPDSADPHPTYYRINTESRIRQVMATAGFVEEEIVAMESDPSYMVFSAPSFLLGVAYERIVNRFESLSRFRGTLLACFRRP